MDAWDADTRFSAQGREVIGAAMAWRQADAFKDAGIRQTYALSPVLAMIDSGEFKANLSTVLVLDEASQIGPRPLLELFEGRAKTGLTIKKMFGDRGAGTDDRGRRQHRDPSPCPAPGGPAGTPHHHAPGHPPRSGNRRPFL